MSENLYHEITPEGFGIAIEKDKDLFSVKSRILFSIYEYILSFSV